MVGCVISDMVWGTSVVDAPVQATSIHSLADMKELGS